jgi:hypothetical protein
VPLGDRDDLQVGIDKPIEDGLPADVGAMPTVLHHGFVARFHFHIFLSGWNLQAMAAQGRFSEPSMRQ